MPLIDAGFTTPEGVGDHTKLISFGPTVEVIVSHHNPDGQEPPEEQEKPESVHGLIDSGASESCIDAQLAQKLGLPIIDIRSIAGVGGAKTHNVYLAQIHIYTLDIFQYGAFTGVDLAEGGQAHQVLLGRTFLQNTVMIYDGIRGQVTVATIKR